MSEKPINLKVISSHDLQVYLRRCELHQEFGGYYELVKEELKDRELK